MNLNEETHKKKKMTRSEAAVMLGGTAMVFPQMCLRVEKKGFTDQWR
jgi:hypothetical protein